MDGATTLRLKHLLTASQLLSTLSPSLARSASLRHRALLHDASSSSASGIHALAVSDGPAFCPLCGGLGVSTRVVRGRVVGWCECGAVTRSGPGEGGDRVGKREGGEAMEGARDKFARVKKRRRVMAERNPSTSTLHTLVSDARITPARSLAPAPVRSLVHPPPAETSTRSTLSDPSPAPTPRPPVDPTPSSSSTGKRSRDRKKKRVGIAEALAKKKATDASGAGGGGLALDDFLKSLR